MRENSLFQCESQQLFFPAINPLKWPIAVAQQKLGKISFAGNRLSSRKVRISLFHTWALLYDYCKTN